MIYRERLAERGWEIVIAHPFFGDQFPWPEMEDLRQGEGIIDIVNSLSGRSVELRIDWPILLFGLHTTWQ